MEKIICIGGGVGPMAGVELHRKIIEQTDAGGTDQGHLEVHHFSRSHDIADRTRFLLGEIDENPAEGMFRTVLAAAAAADALGKSAVIGIPCNTFHAPKIFDRFLELVGKDGKMKVVHMIRETVSAIQQSFPHIKKIGLMSTTGTRQVEVYQQVLEPEGIEVVQVFEEVQPELHDSIYNQEWGIKAQSSPVSPRARQNFERYASMLVSQGAEAIILGCTEIPLALQREKVDGVPLVDPMRVLARALVREAGVDKLKPFE